jgi:hypothetical protein
MQKHISVLRTSENQQGLSLLQILWCAAPICSSQIGCLKAQEKHENRFEAAMNSRYEIKFSYHHNFNILLTKNRVFDLIVFFLN